MNKIILIDSVKCGKVALTFENGERLSIVWDACTYSDNHNDVKGLLQEVETKCSKSWVSTRVEVYGAEGEQINKYLEKEYGQAPAAYVPVNDVPKIIRYIQGLSNEKVSNESSSNS